MPHYEPFTPARRSNYTLRETIEQIMGLVQSRWMPTDTARIALAEVGAAGPVIDRLIGPQVECQP